jgi:hypothetical protein
MKYVEQASARLHHLDQACGTQNRFRSKSEIQLNILGRNVCYIPSSFICKFFSVETRNDVKHSLNLILPNSLILLGNKMKKRTVKRHTYQKVSGPHYKALRDVCLVGLAWTVASVLSVAVLRVTKMGFGEAICSTTGSTR